MEMGVLLAMTPFQWAKKELTYLGIKITPKILGLFAANYPPLLRQLKIDLKRWAPMYMSWFDAIKMVVLPTFLHLFQSLPVDLERK